MTPEYIRTVQLVDCGSTVLIFLGWRTGGVDEVDDPTTDADL